MSSAPRPDVLRAAQAPRAARSTSPRRASGSVAVRLMAPGRRLVLALLLALLLALTGLVAAGPEASAASAGAEGGAVTATTGASVRLSWERAASKRTSTPSDVSVHDHRAMSEGLDVGPRYWSEGRRVSSTDTVLAGFSTVISPATRRAPAALASKAGLRVGSYNIRCANCTSDRPYERPWTERRDDVAAAIKAEDLDVVGLQEASQAWLKGPDGEKIDLSQFEDLRDRLGGAWRLTNAHRNNCVRSESPNNCDRKDQGASQGTKIVYNADRVALLREGSKELPSPAGSNPRFVAWAEFRQSSTGKRFFFADTHLQNKAKNTSVRVEEAKVLADEVERRNVDRLPTLIVGDMNSHKNTKPSNGVYDVLVGDRHYVDPLGNTWHSKDKAGTKAATQTVEKRVGTWLSSWNDFQTTAKGDRARLNGTYLDYIFTTRMRVTEWETVADVDKDNHFRTPPPSDHNLIRATVLLP